MLYSFRLPRKRIFTSRVFVSPISSEVRRWQVYELAKEHWDRAHPEASPAERDAAILEITRRLGI